MIVMFDVEQSDFDEFKNKIDSHPRAPYFTVKYSKKDKRAFLTEKVFITEEFAPNAEMIEHVKFYTEELNKQLEMAAAYCEVDIDARFSRVRTEETNLGTFMADLMRTELNTDFALSNGGSMRANQVYDLGVLNMSFVAQVLPMVDQVVQYKVKGKHMLKILENGVSHYPKFDGRWPLVSGLKFKFDPSKLEGSRILPESFCLEDGTLIEEEKYYTLAVKHFISTGRDGFHTFEDPEVEALPPFRHTAPTVQDVMSNFFRSFQKSDEDIAKLTGKAKQQFEDRMRLFNGNAKNRDENGFIKFSVGTPGRIINLGEPIEHTD
mmetsp:Transcript_5008/g.7494  ORF Transcript_5008/g.7494 Transcript_5008/m.7494 type:complete len:321 (-) Transcript_5008:3-965(-)